jgi:predicted nucleotidyltransferase
MKQELIKPIVRVGNSAGVLVPREWLNGRARVELVEKPLNIKKDILEILEPYLEDIVGIYLVGSYARGEEVEGSDVDVLAISNKTNKKISMGKYWIILISKEGVENALKKSVLPILPMLYEAKTIMNRELIEKYKKERVNKINLKKRLELSKSALAIDREMIKLDKEWPSNCSDAVAYSLVLNLRTVYIINKLKRRGEMSIKELKSLIIKSSGSLKAYEGYLRVKNNKKNREELPVKEAEDLYNYVIKELKKIEKWLKGKRD